MQWHTIKQIFLTFGGPTAKKAIFSYHIIFTVDLWTFYSCNYLQCFLVFFWWKKYTILWSSHKDLMQFPLLNYWGYDTNLVKKKTEIYITEILSWYHENFQWSMFYKLENTIIVSSCMLWSPQCKTRTSNNNIAALN